MVTKLPSYVQDTRHVLMQIDNVSIPPDAILASIDVESLYTSIPHPWGLAATEHFLDKNYPMMGAQNEFLLELLQFALSNYFFQFVDTN